MAEYIDRENYCENICLCNKDLCGREHCSIFGVPAEDVAPIKHGRWVEKENKNGGSHTVCSNCGACQTVIKSYRNYCPKCGAKMDGENNG